MTNVVENTDRKIYRRRLMRGLTAGNPYWAQLGDPDGLPLSEVLALCGGSCKGDQGGIRLFLCGSLSQMSREYVEEALGRGWEFARPYVHKFRSPVYRSLATYDPPIEISVKLVGESWLPGCESMVIAVPAWQALKAEWAKQTDVPLLSTPSKTGQALLWESLPRGSDFPALPDDLATLIRGASPQHRLQRLRLDYSEATHTYDGRWMYAGAALTDRLPIGGARRVGGFTPYQPGWHHVVMRVPQTWGHIGLIPVQSVESGEKTWSYPSDPGATFETWVSEPELTLALSHGWEIVEHLDGYEFDKGRPLAGWARKLIEMRERLQRGPAERGQSYQQREFAAAACREVLNHTIGSFHVDTYEREGVFSQSEWKELVDQWGYTKVRTLEKLRGGKRRAVYPARHTDRLSIYMPHWSAQIWALERAWIAKHALMCDPALLVEIRGDAIYSTAPLPFTDNGNLSQLRPKDV